MVYHHYSIKYQVFWYSIWLTQQIDGLHTLSWRATSQLLITTWQLWSIFWCWWLKNVDISLLTMIFLKMIFSKMWNSTKNLLKSSSLSITPIMMRLWWFTSTNRKKKSKVFFAWWSKSSTISWHRLNWWAIPPDKLNWVNCWSIFISNTIHNWIQEQLFYLSLLISSSWVKGLLWSTFCSICWMELIQWTNIWRMILLLFPSMTNVWLRICSKPTSSGLTNLFNIILPFCSEIYSQRPACLIKLWTWLIGFLKK